MRNLFHVSKKLIFTSLVVLLPMTFLFSQHNASFDEDGVLVLDTSGELGVNYTASTADLFFTESQMIKFFESMTNPCLQFILNYEEQEVGLEIVNGDPLNNNRTAVQWNEYFVIKTSRLLRNLSE